LKDGAVSERSFLSEITIKNLGVIESATLEFEPGLTVLTGETGAGKTMVLTALNLILGGKSDAALVRTGQERLVASGRFTVTKDIAASASEKGADLDGDDLILTRNVNSDGKSKAIAGGIAIPAGTLAELAVELIEIHGQAANLQITKSSKQRELLDRYAGSALQKALIAYQSELASYQNLKNRIATLKSAASKRDAEIAELTEFTNAFNKLKPKNGELAEIDIEISKLSSVEEFRVAIATALGTLEDEDAGSLTSLGVARKALDAVRVKDPEIESVYSNLSDAFFLLGDANSTLNSYLSSLEADPDRLSSLQERKAALNGWFKKYATDGGDFETLIARGDSAKSAMADLAGGDELIVELEKELTGVKKSLLANAKELSSFRDKSAITLATAVSEEIHALSMPHTNLIVQVTHPDYAGALKESDFSAMGCDEITLLLQAHKDGPLVPIAKGASGGEMSRVMLGLEVVLAKVQPVGTYIFDEVDAGVGGKAAIEVGRRLALLAKDAQVIVVTHLPQVAAWADSHFVVKKSSDGSVVASGVNKLAEAERINEIARMLAGLEESASAQEHAAELLAMRANG
jgi:DNA repair protein RecN (Recombination protein N)